MTKAREIAELGQKLTVDASGNLEFAGDLELGDNNKALFGASSDLQIYHNGTHNFITSLVGNISIETTSDDRDIFIKSDDGSGGLVTYIHADGSTGSANLRHYGDIKLATTSTGIDVTGTVTADGLTVENATAGTTASPQYANLNFTGYSSTDRAVIRSVDTSGSANGGQLEILTANASNVNTRRMNINRDGDLSLYEDTGTTAKFFWDASAERLGIGTSSPDYAFEVYSGTASSDVAHFAGGSETARGLVIGTTVISGRNDAGVIYNANDTSGTHIFQINSSGEAMRIDSSGNVGIGTSSPSALLTLSTDGPELLFEDTAGGNHEDYSIVANAGLFKFRNKTTDDDILVLSDTDQRFLTGGTERMRIDSSGNLGINETAPQSLLHITSSSTANNAMLQLENINDNASTAPDIYLYRNSATPADNDYLAAIHALGNNSSGTSKTLAQQFVRVTDVTDSTEEAMHMFFTSKAGTIRNVLNLGATEAVFNEDSQDINFRVESNANGHMFFVDGGNNRIGINESSPEEILHIRADGSNDAKIILENEASPRGNYIGMTGSDNIVIAADEDDVGTDSTILFRVDAGEKMRITDGGKLLINKTVAQPATNAPPTFIEAHDATGASMLLSRSDSTVAAGNNIGAYLFRTNDSSGVKYGGMVSRGRNTTGDAYVGFYSVDTRLQSGIAPDLTILENMNTYLRNASFVLNYDIINGVYQTNEDAFIAYHNGSGTGDTYVEMRVRDGTGGDPVWRHYRRGVLKSEIEENGDFLSATNSYGGTSDERLKENIVASGSQWDDIKALQIKKYSMIEDGLDAPNKLGVIAQDLIASGMNGLVTQTFKTRPNPETQEHEPVLDADGNQEEYYTVKYSVLYMKAIKALQEAMERIETLETENTAIKARLDALEAT